MRQLLKLLVRFLRARELYQLHFLKLMLADDAAHVFAVRTSLAAEAWRISGNRKRQASGIENLIAVKIGERDLGGGDQPQVMLLAFEEIVREFRKLPGAIHGP